jgi:hypothetical protein
MTSGGTGATTGSTGGGMMIDCVTWATVGVVSGSVVTGGLCGVGDGAQTGVVVEEVLWLLLVLVNEPELSVQG